MKPCDDSIGHSETVCCFTGHNTFRTKHLEKIKERLPDTIQWAIDSGVETFLLGGEPGFDFLAAEQVLKLRRKYRHIKLICVLPYLDHTAKWQEQETKCFEKLSQRANGILSLSEVYKYGCMKNRNHFMVAHSHYCICALTNHSRSDTAQTVRYAINTNRIVTNLLYEDSPFYQTLIARKRQLDVIQTNRKLKLKENEYHILDKFI